MSQGKNNAAGGGASLNFDVKAFATEAEILAATPKENVIGIIPKIPMNGWVFSATEPVELVQGMVWITIGTSSTVEFNALKKNAIQVYPLSAKQYVSGAWVDVTAMSYQGGEWASWWNGELYKNGNTYDSLTGGWETNGGAVLDSNYININFVSNANMADANTLEGIDLTDYSQVSFVYEGSINVGTGGTNLMSWVATKKLRSSGGYGVTEPSGAAASHLLKTSGTLGTYTVDVSNLSGSYYVGFHLGKGGAANDQAIGCHLLEVRMIK